MYSGPREGACWTPRAVVACCCWWLPAAEGGCAAFLSPPLSPLGVTVRLCGSCSCACVCVLVCLCAAGVMPFLERSAGLLCPSDRDFADYIVECVAARGTAWCHGHSGCIAGLGSLGLSWTMCAGVLGEQVLDGPQGYAASPGRPRPPHVVHVRGDDQPRPERHVWRGKHGARAVHGSVRMLNSSWSTSTLPPTCAYSATSGLRCLPPTFGCTLVARGGFGCGVIRTHALSPSELAAAYLASMPPFTPAKLGERLLTSPFAQQQ